MRSMRRMRNLFLLTSVFLAFCTSYAAGTRIETEPLRITSALRAKSSASWNRLTTEDADTRFLAVKYAGEPVSDIQAVPLSLRMTHQRMGSNVERNFNLVPWQVVRVPEGMTIGRAAKLYAEDPAVLFVEPSYIVWPLEVRPTDPAYGQLWGMERIGAPEAWAIEQGSHDIIVGVIDTGIRYTHEDLASNMWVNPSPGPMNDIYGATWTSRNGVMTNGDPMDTNGHGTHVAGTIGAVANNMKGVAGVNWNVRMIALKFLDPTGVSIDAAAALEYAIEKGAHLTNNSWGGGGPSDLMRDTIAKARDNDQLFVAAAGNDTQNLDVQNSFPAGYDVDNIIAVASIQQSGALSGFSNYGKTRVHLAAPGSSIYSTVSSSDSAYGSKSGTSMASPHVAGAAALLLAREPALPYDRLKEIILESVHKTDLLAGRVITGGELDLAAAIRMTGARITLNRVAYSVDASPEIEVTVFDPLVNPADPSVDVDWVIRNTEEVSVAAGTLVLARVPATDSFKETLDLTPHNPPHDSIISFDYKRASAEALTALAPIDNEPPQILNLEAYDISDTRFYVGFDTDEDAKSWIHVDGVPLQTNDTFTTSHVFRVDDRDPLTVYSVEVSAEDHAGNVTNAPAFNVFTLFAQEVYATEFLRNDGGWISQHLFGEPVWEYGHFRFGPETASRGWATRIGDRYPDASHATLTTPAFRVGRFPVVTFRHWYDLDYDIQGDFVYIEAKGPGGWENVGILGDDGTTHYKGRISGQSEGWRTYEIHLPKHLENRLLQIRFRFLSDVVREDLENPAGWYIDDFRVRSIVSDDIALLPVEITRLPGHELNFSTGETFQAAFVLANMSTNEMPGIEGELSVLVDGVPVDLPGGSPFTIDFGDLAGQTNSAARPAGGVAVTLPDEFNPENKIVFQLALESSSGWRSVLLQSLDVYPVDSLSGYVTQWQSTNRVAGVNVYAQLGSALYDTVSDGLGEFRFDGVSAGDTYRLWVEGEASTVAATVPATNVHLQYYPPGPHDFVLTPATTNVFLTQREASTIELALSVNLPAGYTAHPPIAFTNATVDHASALIHPVMGGVRDGIPTQMWLTFDTEGVEDGSYTVVPSIDGVDPGVSYNFHVRPRPLLYLRDIEIESDTGVPWLDPGAGDATLRIRIGDYNEDSWVYDLEGTLTSSNTNVYNGSGVWGISWPSPFKNFRVSGDISLNTPALANGEVIDFDLHVRARSSHALELPVEYVEAFFTFSITNYAAVALTGNVTCDRWTDAGVTNVVMSNALVYVENVRGDIIAQDVTDVNGDYAIADLREIPHWVYVEAPADTGGVFYVAPWGEMVDLAVTNQADFVFRDYGKFAPFVTYDGDTVLTSDPQLLRGETYDWQIRVISSGDFAAFSVTGHLYEVDSFYTLGSGYTNVMEVLAYTVSGDDGVAVNSTTTPRTLKPDFPIYVSSDAPKGALQRFNLLVRGENSQKPGQMLEWYFNPRLRADDRISISGSVSPLTAQEMQSVRVTLELGDWGETMRPAKDGSFAFSGIPHGASGTLAVTAVPQGYTLPPAHNIVMVTDDIVHDFTIDLLPLDWTGGTNGLSFTITEGMSTNGTLSITNTAGVARSFDLSVVYRRVTTEAPDTMVAMAEEEDAALSPMKLDLDTLDPDRIVPGEYIFRFAHGVPRQEKVEILAAHGAEAVFFFDAFPAALARVVDDSKPSPLDAVTDPRVTLVAPETKAEARSLPPRIPEDPRFHEQYGLWNVRQTGGTLGADIRAPQAWAHATGSRDVIVAVVDTGIDYKHPDLAGNIWRNPRPGSSSNTNIIGDVHGWNFLDWNEDIVDFHGHGTHVAGIIGAVGDNHIGIAGVNWDVSLMALRIMNGGIATSARIAQAILYAAEQGARVSNHSYGGPDTARVIFDAIQAVAASNHLVVAAADNRALNLDDTIDFPAGYSKLLDNVITVAAADHHGRLASFSAYGPNSVHLVAPGVGVLSTLPGDMYGWASGTSMATPHVAGVAALLWSITPDAHYSVIRDAILQGVRKDAALEPFVITSGHLDAYGAIQTLGAGWLGLSTNMIALDVSGVPGDSFDLQMTINDPAILRYAVDPHVADIWFTDTTSGERFKVPVSVAVEPGAVLRVKSVNINNLTTPGQLPALAGEEVEIRPVLRNMGSGTAASFEATLANGVGNDSTLHEDLATWPIIYGGFSANPLAPFHVELDGSAVSNLTFTLQLPSAVGGDQLDVVVPVLSGDTISGHVYGADGTNPPVAHAAVELIGQLHAARTHTDDNGFFFFRGVPPAPLASGDYRVQVVADGYARQSITNVLHGTTNLLFELDNPDPGIYRQEVIDSLTNLVSVGFVNVTNFQGAVTNVQMTISVSTNGVGQYEAMLRSAPVQRVALISDEQHLSELVDPLRQMGFHVSYYPGNYVMSTLGSALGGPWIWDPQALYSGRRSVLAQYDAVILDKSGINSGGRLLLESERRALLDYLRRGRVLIVTGSNIFTRPDDEYLADLAGVSGFSRVLSLGQAALDLVAGFSSPFISLPVGARILTSSGDRDATVVTAGASSLSVFSVDAGSKLVRSAPSSGGLLYAWNGNPGTADWSEQTVWRDLLRGILWNELIEAKDVQWLTVSDTSVDLVSGGSTNVAISISSGFPLTAGTYEANLVLLGQYAGADILAVPVQLDVHSGAVRVLTSEQVTDWRDQPLRGDGSPESMLYQVLWTAGAVADPDPSGNPSSSVNRLLTSATTGLPYGRIGAGGVTVDKGRFDENFRVPVGMTGGSIFVRAWDSSDFGDAMAYGDSGVSNLVLQADAAYDFGSWRVDQPITPDRERGGFGLPDSWFIENGTFDPREGGAALPSISKGSKLIPVPRGREFASPRRVAVTTNLVFVLDPPNHRVIVMKDGLDPLGETNKLYHAQIGRLDDHPGSDPGEFRSPGGMALDPREEVNRLLVADTLNHRIQIFWFDPADGSVTNMFTFGSQGTGPGQFEKPGSLAIMSDTGYIFVADTGNNRVQIFTPEGVFQHQFSGGSGYVLNKPAGIDVDPVEGIFVADTGNNRIVHYTTGGIGLRTIGAPGTGTGMFTEPVDVQVWRHRQRATNDVSQVLSEVRRLVVVDRLNERLQLFRTDGTFLMQIGIPGAQLGELRLPNGAFPLHDTSEVVVADTGNRRIQYLHVQLDADGDGMDDFWEDMHGLDSSDGSDALGDESGDGISNIAKFWLEMDPRIEDTTITGTAIPDAHGVFRILGASRESSVGVMGAGGDGEDGYMVLLWESVAGRTYRIERSEDLAAQPPIWQSVGTVTASGDVSQFGVPMDEYRGYFRVVVD